MKKKLTTFRLLRKSTERLSAISLQCVPFWFKRLSLDAAFKMVGVLSEAQALKKINLISSNAFPIFENQDLL
jgi:hypothetical protein